MSSELVHFVICVDADESAMTPTVQPIIESDQSDLSRLFVIHFRLQMRRIHMSGR